MVKIEHNEHTVNGVTTSGITVNGKTVRSWRAVLGIVSFAFLSAISVIVLGPAILLLIGISLLLIAVGLIIAGIAAPFAYIYRLVTGKWPSWFQVEVRREGGRK